MRRSTILILICMVVGVAVLASLGFWQVKRLHWKESLISRVEQRVALAPMELSEFLDRQMLEDNWPYSPVKTEGVFDHSKEVYFFTTDKSGISGWNVHTPLRLQDGRVLIVNRGFVSFERKDPSTRPEGQTIGIQPVTGLVRVPTEKSPNSFFPDNKPEEREFFWRDFQVMSELMRASEGERFVPFFVDANDAPNPGGWPKGGTTIISFPNNHLQYAVTWFGLALALLGVGSFFLYSRRQQNDEQ